MVAPKKPNPAGKQTAKKAAATKRPAKQAAPKKTAASSASARPAAATKTAGARKTPATKAPAAKAPAGKSSTVTTPATKSAATKSAPTKRAAAKPAETKPAAARRVPKPPSPDTPALLSNYRPDRHEIPEPRGVSKDGIAYTKDFDVKFLKAQRDELVARRQAELARATRLEDEATSLIEDGEMGDVQFDDEGGEGDTMVVQRDLDRVLSTQARQTIEDIDAALERIKLGTYGYSEVSGLPIPRERLEALPETTVFAAEKVSGIGLR